ncbi:MAG: GYF domain-containing protein [Planctomycetaceae bacterium]
MSETYYLRSRGKVLGPFPLDRLQVMKSRGQLGRTHQVSTDRQSWIAAGTLPELFPAPAAESSFELMDGMNGSGAMESAGSSTGPATQGPAVPVAAWFYHVGEQQFGPTPATEIRQLFSAGELSPNDMVWREGMESWIAIRDVPELRPRSAVNTGSSGTGTNGESSTSGMAITSLVLGVVSLVIPCVGIATGPLAVIFGGVSLSQVNRSRGRLTGKGMAIAGLVTGIVATTFYGLYFLLVVLGTLGTPAMNSLN